eukprot:6257029-Prymnesium_polylepis.3
MRVPYPALTCVQSCRDDLDRKDLVHQRNPQDSEDTSFIKAQTKGIWCHNASYPRTHAPDHSAPAL